MRCFPEDQRRQACVGKTRGNEEQLEQESLDIYLIQGNSGHGGLGGPRVVVRDVLVEKFLMFRDRRMRGRFRERSRERERSLEPSGRSRERDMFRERLEK